MYREISRRRETTAAMLDDVIALLDVVSCDAYYLCTQPPSKFGDRVIPGAFASRAKDINVDKYETSRDARKFYGNDNET